MLIAWCKHLSEFKRTRKFLCKLTLFCINLWKHKLLFPFLKPTIGGLKGNRLAFLKKNRTLSCSIYTPCVCSSIDQPNLTTFLLHLDWQRWLTSFSWSSNCTFCLSLALSTHYWWVPSHGTWVKHHCVVCSPVMEREPHPLPWLRTSCPQPEKKIALSNSNGRLLNTLKIIKDIRAAIGFLLFLVGPNKHLLKSPN